METQVKEFIGYGTPLKDLEKDEIPLKKAVQDETVRDEQGRRRFHGAFTGGFSAGYYNTVGTKEGWLPSAFKSSRSKKASQQFQRPEDFMDTEDLGSFGIAPRTVHTTKDFQDPTVADRNSSRKRPRSPGPIPGVSASLGALIRPVSESIGVRLLCNLGWRPGQGIGPRVARSKKKKKTELPPLPGAKIYGCSLPPGSEESDEEDETILYAPKDIEVPLYTAKDNLHGIGYKGLSQESVLSTHINLFEPTSTRALLPKEKKKLSISGQAFGVGAFEVEDEDIYARDDMRQYNFFLEDDPSATQQKPKKSCRNIPGICKALEGFHLSKKPPKPKTNYPAPTLPPDFRPVHNPSAQPQPDPKPPGLDRHRLDAKSRGSMLETKSIFTMLRPEDRARLQGIMTKMNPEAASQLNLPPPPPSPPTPPPPPARPDLPVTIRPSDFKPFAKDDEKQKRYDVYLTLLAAGNKEGLSNLQPRSMTEWERQRERDEFERAAVLYQPLSTRGGGLGSRFVSAGRHDDDDRMVEVPLDQEKDHQKLEDQAAAAKMKMFGQLTRERFPWHPAKVLCKRFNVPNPYPDSTEVGVPTVKRDKFSIFNFLTVPQEEDGSESKLEGEPPTEARPQDIASPSPPSPVPQKEPPPPGLDGEEPERPSMDLFKAVFGNTSSEDEGPNDEEKEAPAKPPPSEVQQPAPRTSHQRASGVFANLDLDAISRRVPRQPAAAPVAAATPAEAPSPPKSPPPADDSSYGPAIPPSGALPWESSELAYHMYKNKDEQFYKSSAKKHKKLKKHKSSKKKKKSKKESYEADNSSSDSNSGLTDSQILERIRRMQKR